MQSLLTDLRAARPVIHCITNYVTANDCANLLLACGASPVMADAPEEAAEITSGSRALVLNLGTLSDSRLRAMLLAGAQANRMQIPVVLDPVGIGASAFRREAVQKLLGAVQVSAIRGNLSEMLSLYDSTRQSPGVDTASGDTAYAADCAAELAQKHRCCVILSGKEDVVTNGDTLRRFRCGHPVLKTVTGAGCMLSALTAAFLSVRCTSESCAAAVCAMGLAGEIAAARMTASDGNASCRNYLIDAVFRMTDNDISEEYKRADLT